MTKTNSQLKFTDIPYHKDLLLDYFSVIEKQPWAMFLHSASQDHCNSRFDILVADPIATLSHQNGKNTIWFNTGEMEINKEDPFSALEKLQSTLLDKIPTHKTLPFLGGALGYFSYDLGKQLETLPLIAKKELDTPDMAIGIYDWAFILDHQEKKAVVIEPEFSNRLVWLKAKQASQQKALKDASNFKLTSAWSSNMTQQSYQEKFAQVNAYILDGDCYQINLAQRFKAHYQGSEWQAYKKLAQTNATPFSAFIRIENNAILSFSPERFLLLDGAHIETKPIKGTRARSQDPKIDASNKLELQHSEKDRAENLMIVDLLRNDIGRVAAVGTVRVPKLFHVESFPSVHHLVSTITGTLSNKYSATDLLRACFPGGSIIGTPKVRAMAIIEELEPDRRVVYCGSIGYISRCGKMDTSISIRTLICSNNQIYAWAGGGLVMDSQVDAEYQETLDKLNKILPVLEENSN